MNIARFMAICFLLFAPLTLGAEEQSEGTDCIEPEIWLVNAGGWWTKNDRDYGNYRVFVKNLGWEHTRSFLYLQWLRSDSEKQQVSPLKTIPIPEFNETDWHNVINIERKDNTFLIVFTVRGREDAKRTAVLSPGLPGKYHYVAK